MFLMVASLVLLTGPAQPSVPPALESVRAEASEGVVTLTFATTSASVPTEVKLLESPFRLYFDIPGLRPGTEANWSVGLGAVRQVRAALNQRDPVVTRVVVDLVERVSWKVEPGRSPREFRLIVTGTGGFASTPPADRVEPVEPMEPAEPAEPAAEPRVVQITAGLDALAPVLESMRAGDGPSDAALTVLLSRAETLADAARAMRGPDGSSHALLRATADAVLTAARARAAALASGDAQARANAASAAAGALLLLDRLR